jgi:hypothetical protein
MVHGTDPDRRGGRGGSKGGDVDGLSALGLAPPNNSSQRALFDYFSISESKINVYVSEQSTVSNAVVPML